MHPALLQLIVLQSKGLLRRSVRGARSPRGLVFFILGVALLLGLLIRGIMHAYGGWRFPPENGRAFFPLAMLAVCGVSLITSVGERAVAFMPAEVDFLFAGPFSRRQLLGYKMLRSAFGALFTASIFSVMFVRYTRVWAAGWLGIFLALLFQQLFSMSVVLIGQTVGERAYTRGRAVLVAGLVALGVVAAAPLLASDAHHSLDELVAGLRRSTVGSLVLAPFDVFARIVVAPALVPDALPWTALAAAMIAGLVVVVLWLDAHYLEASAAAGQHIYERARRIRRGLGPLRASAWVRARIPLPPRLGGVGPIAWRQLTAALRQSRSVMFMLLIICVAFAAVLRVGGFGGGHGSPAGIVMGGLYWLTFMFSNMLRFDFRGDIDHIDTLKALPVPAVATCTGQLVAPVVVMALSQFALLAVASVMLSPDPRLVFGTAALVVPFDILLIGVENLIFLVFPVRINPVSPGDLEGWGRQMIVLVLKMVILTILCGVAACLALPAVRFGGGGLVAYIGTMAAIMVLEAVAFLPALALAFRRFDPSLDTPG